MYEIEIYGIQDLRDRSVKQKCCSLCRESDAQLERPRISRFFAKLPLVSLRLCSESAAKCEEKVVHWLKPFRAAKVLRCSKTRCGFNYLASIVASLIP